VRRKAKNLRDGFYPFFCLDTKETKNQGTGLLLGSETIYLNYFYINRTISSPPETLLSSVLKPKHPSAGEL